MAEISYRHARHQKILQHPVPNGVDSRGRDTFVVEIVSACQFYAIQFFQRRVVDDAQKRRQHLLVYLLRECLSLRLIPLAMAFEPVSEDLVKEDCGGSARQQSRSRKRLRSRGRTQGLQIRGNLVDLCRELRVRWKLVG